MDEIPAFEPVVKKQTSMLEILKQAQNKQPPTQNTQQLQQGSQSSMNQMMAPYGQQAGQPTQVTAQPGQQGQQPGQPPQHWLAQQNQLRLQALSVQSPQLTGNQV